MADLAVLIVAYVLVALTAWEATRGWVRRRDRYQADLLAVVAVLAGILLFGRPATAVGARHPVIGYIVNLLFLSQPYLLLRLVQRFDYVPGPLLVISITCAIVGALGLSTRMPSEGPAWMLAVSGYFTVTLGYAAWTFMRGAKRATGVSARRLWYAGAGTWLHVAIAIGVGLTVFIPSLEPHAPSINRLLGVGVFACYYVGLVAPAPLRAAWARREIYEYLLDTTTREPGERARHAADDLARAAARGVAAAATAVLLADEAHERALVVRAASDPAWIDLDVVLDGGLVGRTFATGTPATGLPKDCEIEITSLVSRAGSTVWTVPIATPERRWGVLLVVEQNGSLFPDDDRELVGVLCRHAASTMDHGRLIADERERQLAAADRSLRGHESRFRLILQSIRDYAVLLVDTNGDIVASLGGAEAIFGRLPADASGRSVTAAALFDRTPADFLSDLEHARQHGHFERDGRCRRFNGTEFLGSTIIRPMLPSAGGPAFVVVTRDESARLSTSRPS